MKQAVHLSLIQNNYDEETRMNGSVSTIVCDEGDGTSEHKYYTKLTLWNLLASSIAYNNQVVDYSLNSLLQNLYAFNHPSKSLLCTKQTMVLASWSLSVWYFVSRSYQLFIHFRSWCTNGDGDGARDTPTTAESSFVREGSKCFRRGGQGTQCQQAVTSTM